MFTSNKLQIVAEKSSRSMCFLNKYTILMFDVLLHQDLLVELNDCTVFDSDG